MRKVLIADDDPELRDMCGLVLRNEGYHVIEAADAAGCIAMARKEAPDVILLDWMMPGLDGMDALRALKASPKTRDIPVVMLTALDGLAEITMATYNGADGYVTKPFEMKDLIALVHRFTEPASARPRPGSAPTG